MPRVLFVDLNLGAEIAVGESVLTAAEACGAPEASRCGGVCACSTCHVYVLSGADLLAPPNDAELDLLELSAKDRRETSRLGCQSRVLSDGTVEVALSAESFQTYLDLHPEDRERALALWLARRPV